MRLSGSWRQDSERGSLIGTNVRGEGKGIGVRSAEAVSKSEAGGATQ